MYPEEMVAPFTWYQPPPWSVWPSTVSVAPSAAAPRTDALVDGPERTLRPTGLSTVRCPEVWTVVEVPPPVPPVPPGPEGDSTETVVVVAEPEPPPPQPATATRMTASRATRDRRGVGAALFHPVDRT